jgi:flagellar motor switch/type III secretory pathway protein FliN
MTAGWKGFALDALPRIPAEAASLTTALARALARVPVRLGFSAKGVGEVEIQPDQVSFVARGAGAGLDGMDCFPLDHGGRRGWVGVEQRFSLALVRAVLGPGLITLRPLARSERGILAAILLSVLDQIGLSQKFRLGLGTPTEQPDAAQDRLAVGCAVRTASALGGRLHLAIPSDWLGLVTGPVMRNWEGLTVLASLELARTDLSRQTLSSASPRDAVVFEGIPAIESDISWPVVLRVGDSLAPACLAMGSRLSLTGPFSQVEEDSQAMSAEDEKTQWLPTDPSASDVANIVGRAPVEVVAEIGRFTLRGDELAGLMKGGVLSLGSRRTDTIQLRVGGQLWAAGELVSLGDELGVRILKLHAG